jgi:AcrR family transcriptional regulator
VLHGLYGAKTPRRRDALRNRAAIVSAAAEAMTTRSSVVGMPEIARRAGVGQATLYRHFPDRYALADAVIADQIQRLEECVAALRDHPGGFRMLLDGILRVQLTMRPLVLLARRLEPAVLARHQRRIIGLLSGPLRLAQERCLVRKDLVPEDVVLLFTMVEAVVDGDGDAARSIDLALDGVFAFQAKMGPTGG